MKSEEIQKFVDLLSGDKEMLAGLVASIGPHMNDVEKNQEAVLNEIVSLAKEKGFDISEQDIKAFFESRMEALKNDGELSMEQLETVTGGGVGKAIGMSVALIGLGCGITSAVTAIMGDDCGKKLGEGLQPNPGYRGI